jgi:phosphatidate cytidylyltransferase
MKFSPKNAGTMRVWTALLGIACVVPIVLRGGAWFNALVVLLAFAGLRELIVAARRSAAPVMPEVAYPALAWLITWLWQGTNPNLWAGDRASFQSLLLMTASLFMVPLALLVRAVWRFGGRKPASLASVGLTQLAVSYCALFAFLMLLRALPTHGRALFFMLLLGVWAGDTLAYYGGKMFGRRPLTALSPNKTREGALVGILAAVVVALAVAFNQPWQLADKIVLAVLIAVFAPLGDLAESLWKRELEIKDLGKTLPGHGGILDRCDSLLFAALPVYFFAIWRMI